MEYGARFAVSGRTCVFTTRSLIILKLVESTQSIQTFVSASSMSDIPAYYAEKISMWTSAKLTFIVI